ncbi:hypothetical protein JKP88DRAFT_334549 [Tribonema minus]|uniref:Uncharacterized protein n=1 Tax=Tribonema minus TaxID=303371 RepID=A0A835YK13_9STRA|nr:hypothetical protein JKP88DRAFT_334549 [Tribonema minus]
MRAVASDCRERLCARGYERPQFHAAGDADAREVLVALAWAMADGRAFDRYWGARLERCGLRCGDATREQDKQQTPTALPEWPLPYDVTDTPAALEEAAQAMLEELSATATAPPPHADALGCARGTTYAFAHLNFDDTNYDDLKFNDCWTWQLHCNCLPHACADALGRARHGVNAMLAQYGRLDALLRELEGLERGRARLIHKLQQISAQQQLDTTTDASRRERAPLPATPLGLCLAPLPRLQDAQAAHVTRLNATLRAAAAARPLERQWWKWVTAAAAAPAAAPLPPPPPLPGSAAAAAAVPTASAAPALPAAAAAASAAAAEGDELSGVQLTRGEERLLAALRGAAAAAAPVVRARLLQAAEPWGGLRELAGGSAQTMPAPAAAATAAATRALHSEAASIMAAATQAGLGSLLSAHDVHSAGPGTPPPEPPMAGQGAREWWGEGGEEGGEAALVLRRASAEAELRRTVERCERAMLHDANWL